MHSIILLGWMDGRMDGWTDGSVRMHEGCIIFERTTSD